MNIGPWQGVVPDPGACRLVCLMYQRRTVSSNPSSCCRPRLGLSASQREQDDAQRRGRGQAGRRCGVVSSCDSCLVGCSGQPWPLNVLYDHACAPYMTTTLPPEAANRAHGTGTEATVAPVRASRCRRPVKRTAASTLLLHDASGWSAAGRSAL